MTRRGSSWRDGKTTAERGYGGAWQRARLRFLSQNPLCAKCKVKGRVRGADVVDHIRPHCGDMSIFWDVDNWQSLCKSCHDVDKRAEEGRGGRMGCGPDGLPLDPAHPWNRK